MLEFRDDNANKLLHIITVLLIAALDSTVLVLSLRFRANGVY